MRQGYEVGGRKRRGGKPCWLLYAKTTMGRQTKMPPPPPTAGEKEEEGAMLLLARCTIWGGRMKKEVTHKKTGQIAHAEPEI